MEGEGEYDEKTPEAANDGFVHGCEKTYLWEHIQSFQYKVNELITWQSDEDGIFTASLKPQVDVLKINKFLPLP